MNNNESKSDSTKNTQGRRRYFGRTITFLHPLYGEREGQISYKEDGVSITYNRPDGREASVFALNGTYDEYDISF